MLWVSRFLKGATLMDNAEWIWISAESFPELQSCPINYLWKWKDGQKFGVCAFKKEIKLKERPLKVVFSVSGDNTFRLYCNGGYIGSGPASAGGDFGDAAPMSYIYYSDMEYRLDGDTLDIYAEVKSGTDVLNEFSYGSGGFILCATVYYRNGKTECFRTDESWDVRVLPQYIDNRNVDMRTSPSEWEKAVVNRTVKRRLKPSPIRNLREEAVDPENFAPITLAPSEEKEIKLTFDRICAAYPVISVSGNSELELKLKAVEIQGSEQDAGKVIFCGDATYRALRMYSIGELWITAKNNGAEPVCITDCHIVASYYPTSTTLVNEKRDEREGDFICSDEYLNRLYELCRYTDKICRQSIHLDSPLHQELLACTGDYMIESLIEQYAFGDLDLTRFDIVRTADQLRKTGGRMFHTTYSLLWVQMLYDYYMYTADISLLEETADVISLLLERFHTYIGASGVIENAPNYMFVDWLNIDEYSLHHPPKALGQTVLNAFYYNALRLSSKIFTELKDTEISERIGRRAEALKTAYNRCFYDAERKMYFSGMNTADSAIAPPDQWMPENPLKRYYNVHENVLSVLYGLCDPFEKQALIVRVLEDDTFVQPQPYFMHFVLEAVYTAGLWDRYGMALLQRWRDCTSRTEKGLAEAWSNFNGDYSHAWGGTPAYQLPSKLSGMKILASGCDVISLKPRLYGLESADIRIPTRHGQISISMRKGEEPIVSVPSGITVL